MRNIVILCPSEAGSQAIIEHYENKLSFRHVKRKLTLHAIKLEWKMFDTVTELTPSFDEKEKEHWILKNATEIIILEHEQKEIQVQMMYVSEKQIVPPHGYPAVISDASYLVDCIYLLKKQYNVIQHYIDNVIPDWNKKRLLYSSYDAENNSLNINNEYNHSYNFHIKAKGFCIDILRPGGLKWDRLLKL